MTTGWPDNIMGIAVKRAPLGANRHDSGGARKTLGVIHDIEGSAASAKAFFATDGPPGVGGGSATFVADPANGCFWQFMDANDTAYGVGNYPYNQRAIQVELPGFAGQTFDALVLDYAARFLAWCHNDSGIPLDYITLGGFNNNPNFAGVTGHDQVPSPNNPSHGGGKDEHHDPGPTFPWNDVLAKARAYAGNPPSGGGGGGSGRGGGDTTDFGLWPTGYRIGSSFLGAWATLNGHIPANYAGAPAASIAVLGYPVGREFVDEGQSPHLVAQYFERARLEKHPDGTITLGLLGSEQWAERKRYLPAEVSTPEG